MVPRAKVFWRGYSYLRQESGFFFLGPWNGFQNWAREGHSIWVACEDHKAQTTDGPSLEDELRLNGLEDVRASVMGVLGESGTTVLEDNSSAST